VTEFRIDTLDLAEIRQQIGFAVLLCERIQTTVMINEGVDITYDHVDLLEDIAGLGLRLQTTGNIAREAHLVSLSKHAEMQQRTELNRTQDVRD